MIRNSLNSFTLFFIIINKSIYLSVYTYINIYEKVGVFFNMVLVLQS